MTAEETMQHLLDNSAAKIAQLEEDIAGLQNAKRTLLTMRQTVRDNTTQIGTITEYGRLQLKRLIEEAICEFE